MSTKKTDVIGLFQVRLCKEHEERGEASVDENDYERQPLFPIRNSACAALQSSLVA